MLDEDREMYKKFFSKFAEDELADGIAEFERVGLDHLADSLATALYVLYGAENGV